MPLALTCSLGWALRLRYLARKNAVEAVRWRTTASRMTSLADFAAKAGTGLYTPQRLSENLYGLEDAAKAGLDAKIRTS